MTKLTLARRKTADQSRFGEICGHFRAGRRRRGHAPPADTATLWVSGHLEVGKSLRRACQRRDRAALRRLAWLAPPPAAEALSRSLPTAPAVSQTTTLPNDDGTPIKRRTGTRPRPQAGNQPSTSLVCRYGKITCEEG